MNYSTIKRRTPLKKYSKSQDSVLMRKCDKIIAKIIKKRDNYTCQRCFSKSKQLNTCHFYSRFMKGLRYEFDNLVCLCVGCHFYFHHNPIEFVEFWEKRIGKEAMERLRVKKNTIARPDYKLMYFKLTAYLKEMEEKTC